MARKRKRSRGFGDATDVALGGMVLVGLITVGAVVYLVNKDRR